MKINNWKHFLLPAVLFLIVITFFILPYCKKDTECRSTIVILNRYTSKPVVNAKILITCSNSADVKCTIRDSGITSSEGKYLYNRSLEAILKVQALVDTTTKTPLNNTLNNIQLYGWDLLYLKSGKNVTLTILVDTAFRVQ